MPEIQKQNIIMYQSYKNNKYGSIFRLWVQILLSLWDWNYLRTYLLSMYPSYLKKKF